MRLTRDQQRLSPSVPGFSGTKLASLCLKQVRRTENAGVQGVLSVVQAGWTGPGHALARTGAGQSLETMFFASRDIGSRHIAQLDP